MRKLRVLLVEDKGLVAAGLKAQLESLGYHVLVLPRNGMEVVRSARSLEPDLIIIDVRIPPTDGIKAARLILAHQAIPIIIVTAYAAADLVRQAREAGVMAFLRSPVDRRQLHATIQVALNRFEELQAIRREVNDLKEALETRKRVEHAKGLLMRWLHLSEAEAFRRLDRDGQRSRTGLVEVASMIVRADELLVRKPPIARTLRVVLDVVQQEETAMAGRAASGRAA